MDGSFQFLDILIYAMIAAFIFMRLRGVLGRRTDNERPPLHGRGGDGHGSQHGGEGMEDINPEFSEERDIQRTLSPQVRKEVIRIGRMEPNFSLVDFLDGAKKAYTLVLEAFWAGKKDAFRPFLSDEVFEQFTGAIDDRESEGLVVENRLLETDEMNIDSAQLLDRTIKITIKFVSDIIAVTRDRDGRLVEGDLSDSIRVTDIWTFAKEAGSRDPNWLLVSTRAG